MKKKLQLKREIVSILDRRQMQYLTKGGEIYTKNCTGSKAKTCILDTKVVNCGTLTSYTCPTEKNCDTNPCIVPGETDGCVLRTEGVACIDETEGVCLTPISDFCAVNTVEDCFH